MKKKKHKFESLREMALKKEKVKALKKSRRNNESYGKK